MRRVRRRSVATPALSTATAKQRDDDEYESAASVVATPALSTTTAERSATTTTARARARSRTSPSIGSAVCSAWHVSRYGVA